MCGQLSIVLEIIFAIQLLVAVGSIIICTKLIYTNWIVVKTIRCIEQWKSLLRLVRGLFEQRASIIHISIHMNYRFLSDRQKNQRAMIQMNGLKTKRHFGSRRFANIRHFRVAHKPLFKRHSKWSPCWEPGDGAGSAATLGAWKATTRVRFSKYISLLFDSLTQPKGVGQKWR